MAARKSTRRPADSSLSRKPTPAEVKAAREYLAQHPQHRSYALTVQQIDDLLDWVRSARAAVDVCVMALRADENSDVGESAALVLLDMDKQLAPVEALLHDLDRHEIPGEVATTGEPSGTEDRRTDAQKLYDDVARLAREFNGLLAEIPPLGDLPETHSTVEALQYVEVHLQDAVAYVRRVRKGPTRKSRGCHERP